MRQREDKLTAQITRAARRHSQRTGSEWDYLHGRIYMQFVSDTHMGNDLEP